ncbi:MAG: heme-binding protein [Planctomycetia bacterium]
MPRPAISRTLPSTRLLVLAVCLVPSVARAETRWEQAAETMPAGAAPGRPDGGTFALPAGFVVERLFVVPKDELGSRVCLTAAPGGRLYASDQGGRGLVRITPAPFDGSGPTVVEKVPAPIGNAQGLLWAFDSLYVVCNGKETGLHRVTDSDGDGMPDAVTTLRRFTGAGEHGPHAVALSPDGTRLLIVCGNHTKLPFDVRDVTEPQTMGGIRSSQRRVELAADGASRLPANWDEDQIIRRMWDANGHAAGVLAPGGFVVSTDPEGRSWEVWTAGYRNAYDMAFNADGELFVYDSDMEWDLGTPWYKPTRVNHAPSGSELGWRSGSGNWPPGMPDCLPAVVDIGPGSPVGVAFGYGTTFPARYQRALFVCDWTFGTMYAIHLQPDGSTYTGRREEFLSRTPLPLTDLAVGADGGLYFTVGGRGAQSELYRVVYTGSEPTAAVEYRQPDPAGRRATRHGLERFHRRAEDPAAAVAAALPQLSSADRFIRYAARVALEHQPVAAWQAQALAVADARGLIEGVIAVAHQAEQTASPAVLAALEQIDPARLDAAGKVDLVRAYELTLIRLGGPSAEARDRIVSRLSPLFPSGEYELDRALAGLLVALRAPGIVSRLVSLLATPTAAPGAANLAQTEADLQRLIDRNGNYAKAVRETLARRSDLLQVHCAYVLRTVDDRAAWTIGDRKRYHEWFGRARAWGGGNSFQKFLGAIEKESLAGLPEADRLVIEGLRSKYVPPPLPTPEGPGREWTTEAVLAAAETGLATGSRDFDRGARMFAAARCVVCHRFGTEGGSTGPDLTQAGGRFQVRDMVEAICEPSKVISDQYKGSIVLTADGRVLTGRIVAESPTAVTIFTNPEDATAFSELKRDDIEEILPARESLMPKGLLDQLNESEVLDLIAYTLSRGDRKDPRFK